MHLDDRFEDPSLILHYDGLENLRVFNEEVVTSLILYAKLRRHSHNAMCPEHPIAGLPVGLILDSLHRVALYVALGKRGLSGDLIIELFLDGELRVEVVVDGRRLVVERIDQQVSVSVKIESHHKVLVCLQEVSDGSSLRL